ncbi:hypothetical protein [Paraclostridium sordellii]|nr:hypothetical protein [Paeniclostridium sordellii]
MISITHKLFFQILNPFILVGILYVGYKSICSVEKKITKIIKSLK